MADEWCPFDEAEFRLDQYDHFFPREMVADIFGSHPQELEDWLTENCPNNYCYVWVRETYTWGSGKGPQIVGDLVGMPKDVAIALKLITSVEILYSNSFNIKKIYKRDNVYIFCVEHLEDSKIVYRM